MNQQTLFLAWHDKRLTREWFPVGRLDVGADGKTYRFRYIRGADLATKRAGFAPLIDFPELGRSYESCVLFPLFMNRIMQPHRLDFPEYLRMLDLPQGAKAADILKINGGYRATDNFEVFPKIEPRQDGSFETRFFLQGWQHINADAKSRIAQLKPGENLNLAIELTNAIVLVTVQIQTKDYYMIGWAPRYLVTDLVHAIASSPSEYKAKVIRVNPAPAPAKQRLLIELTGRWPDYQPMSSGDFELLAA